MDKMGLTFFASTTAVERSRWPCRRGTSDGHPRGSRGPEEGRPPGGSDVEVEAGAAMVLLLGDIFCACRPAPRHKEFLRAGGSGWGAAVVFSLAGRSGLG